MPHRGPDFLCIGAQKAGTTWLHENLIQHPRIWLPPVKELHFLDHPPPSLAKRLWSKTSHHRLARKNLKNAILNATPGTAGLKLAWQIAMGRRNWEWYDRLFDGAGDHIAGEICPGYARLDHEKISEIAARFPDLKIIYLLRDPVDRAWSSVAMHYRKDGAGLVTDRRSDEVLARLRKPKSFGHCTYRQNIAAWSRHFPASQIYFGFFDRIRSEPQAYLEEILGFLGLARCFSSKNPAVPVNQGKGEQVPLELERSIATLLLPEAEHLHRRFANPYTRLWLDHASQLSGANHI